MKKTLILASLIAFAASTQCIAAETTTTPAAPAIPTKKVECAEKTLPPEMHRPPRGHECNCKQEAKKAEFEKRLKLTDEQKAQAKAIREKGRQAMEPVMEKIKQKHDEIRAVRLSRIAPQMQEEKINAIKGELKELKRQAHELRIKNAKEFESILTKKQLKELKKMKDEGRKKFEKEFKKKHGKDFRPPFPPKFGPKPPVAEPHPAPEAPAEAK